MTTAVTPSEMLCIRWTIPDSAVAWEWIPDLALIYAGELLSAGPAGPLYLAPTEIFHPAWTHPENRRSIQALRDNTALFAQEASITPDNMIMYWMRQLTAISWDRSTGDIRRHVASPRKNTFAVILPGAAETTINDLISANKYAQSVLACSVLQ